MTDIDITKLDEVVDILESVFGDLLPEGAIVRILSVGGLSVARRLLRWLQSDSSASSGGVDVQFEIILTETCDSLKCDEADSLSEELYQTVTTDFAKQVESGALTTSIQTQAADAGVESLSSVSISSVKTGQPTVTVREAKDQTLPTDPDDDDDSSSHILATMVSSLVLVVVSSTVAHIFLYYITNLSSKTNISLSYWPIFSHFTHLPNIIWTRDPHSLHSHYQAQSPIPLDTVQARQVKRLMPHLHLQSLHKTYHTLEA